MMKPPVAAGRGSGGLAYDIVPGKPDKSILVFRTASTDAGIMMPELGKRLVHEEGLALVARVDRGHAAGGNKPRAKAAGGD